jgi:hypothetical protein
MNRVEIGFLCTGLYFAAMIGGHMLGVKISRLTGWSEEGCTWVAMVLGIGMAVSFLPS